jgi:paraquat-inducible protein A
MNNTVNDAAVAEIGSAWIACPSCDHLYNLSALSDGQIASCHLCGHQLAACDSRSFSKVAAYAIAALIFLALGCSFPFMSFQEGGVESVMTLPQTVLQLYTQGRPTLSFLVAGFIILIPMSLMIIVLLLMMALAGGWRKRWLVGAGHLVSVSVET